LGIENLCDQSSILASMPILVGRGTDGTSVNIAQHSSIKANLCRTIPWIYWSWCITHRLELASKVSPLFKCIEDLLLRLYYLYEKSPKKVRELKSIVEDLQLVFEFKGHGCLPVRAQGSHAVA